MEMPIEADHRVPVVRTFDGFVLLTIDVKLETPSGYSRDLFEHWTNEEPTSTQKVTSSDGITGRYRCGCCQDRHPFHTLKSDRTKWGARERGLDASRRRVSRVSG